MPPELRRRLQPQFERAAKLLTDSECDHSEVNRLLLECVTADAGNLIYLDAFLGHLQRWQKPQPANWSLQAFYDWCQHRTLRSRVASKQWGKVLELGPRILVQRPADVTIYRALAQACADLQFQHAEIRYLRTALSLFAQDLDLNRQAARAFQRHGLFDEAVECWLRIKLANSNDAETQAALKQLDMTSQVAASAATIAALPQGLAADRSENTSSLQSRERLEELTLLKQQQNLTVAERLEAVEGTPAARDLVSQMRQELNRQELDFFNRRSERYPADAELKLQLALRLKRAGNYAEAIKCLELVAKNSPSDGRVLLELGECHQMLRRFPRAVAVYGEAISAARQAADGELTKLCLYRAAILANALNDLAAAAAWLAEICEQDSSYKDAQHRLDKIRQIRHKG